MTAQVPFYCWHSRPARKLPSVTNTRVGPTKLMSEKAAQTRRQGRLVVTLPKLRCLEKIEESED